MRLRHSNPIAYVSAPVPLPLAHTRMHTRTRTQRRAPFARCVPTVRPLRAIAMQHAYAMRCEQHCLDAAPNTARLPTVPFGSGRPTAAGTEGEGSGSRRARVRGKPYRSPPAASHTTARTQWPREACPLCRTSARARASTPMRTCNMRAPMRTRERANGHARARQCARAICARLGRNLRRRAAVKVVRQRRLPGNRTARLSSVLPPGSPARCAHVFARACSCVCARRSPYPGGLGTALHCTALLCSVPEWNWHYG